MTLGASFSGCDRTRDMSAGKVFSRRQWLVGLPACVVTTGMSTRSWAGAAYPISLSELVTLSRAVVVGTPRSASCAWETQGNTRRIVTVSEVEVVQSVDGRAVSDTRLFVKTLGGKVGDIGQIVHGEASLELQRPSVLFLRDADRGRLAVTAMAQGHFPLLDDDSGTPRLHTSPKLGDFVADDPYCAVARLRGKTVTACEELVLEELLHGN